MVLFAPIVVRTKVLESTAASRSKAIRPLLTTKSAVFISLAALTGRLDPDATPVVDTISAEFSSNLPPTSIVCAPDALTTALE